MPDALAMIIFSRRTREHIVFRDSMICEAVARSDLGCLIKPNRKLTIQRDRKFCRGIIRCHNTRSVFVSFRRRHFKHRKHQAKSLGLPRVAFSALSLFRFSPAAELTSLSRSPPVNSSVRLPPSFAILLHEGYAMFQGVFQGDVNLYLVDAPSFIKDLRRIHSHLPSYLDGTIWIPFISLGPESHSARVKLLLLIFLFETV